MAISLLWGSVVCWVFYCIFAILDVWWWTRESGSHESTIPQYRWLLGGAYSASVIDPRAPSIGSLVSSATSVSPRSRTGEEVIPCLLCGNELPSDVPILLSVFQHLPPQYKSHGLSGLYPGKLGLEQQWRPKTLASRHRPRFAGRGRESSFASGL